MPTEELQAPITETDITIEPTVEQSDNPTDIDKIPDINTTAEPAYNPTISITTENHDNTSYTPETEQPDNTPSAIYNSIIGEEEEENIKPPTTTPQINLTTPADEIATYTETYQPPQLPQYTGTATTPNIQANLFFDTSRYPITTIGKAPYNKSMEKVPDVRLIELYKTIMEARKIDAEYLHETQASLLDTIEYIINTDKEDTEIYALKLTKEIYKDTISSESEYEETTKTINAYLDFLKDAGVLEAGEFKKVYDDSETELMEHTYTINPDAHYQLNSAYKDALASGADELSITEANELFIDFLQCKARDP